MEFEEMKMIWDSQDQQPVYAIDQAALHRRIKAKGQTIKRSIFWFELAVIAVSLGASIVLTVDGIAEGEHWLQYLSAAILFLIFLYAWIMRRDRRKREARFNDSLRGDLERAIFQIDFTIGRARAFLWWYILPTTVAFTLSIYAQDKPLWLVGVTLLVFALALLGNEWEIRCVHLAKKRDLESLRAMLVAADEP